MRSLDEAREAWLAAARNLDVLYAGLAGEQPVPETLMRVLAAARQSMAALENFTSEVAAENRRLSEIMADLVCMLESTPPPSVSGLSSAGRQPAA